MGKPTRSRRQHTDPARALRAVIEDVKREHGPDAVPARVWAQDPASHVHFATIFQGEARPTCAVCRRLVDWSGELLEG
jgi:hypothetical protein